MIRSGRHQRVYRRYWCKSCKKIFNDKTRTIFQDSRFPLRVWFAAALLLQQNMNIRDVSTALRMRYDPAHRMVKRLRGTPYADLIARSLSQSLAA